MAKLETAVQGAKPNATGLPSERLTILDQRWFFGDSAAFFGTPSVQDYLEHEILTCHVLLKEARARVGKRTMILNGHYRVPAAEAHRIWIRPHEKSTKVVAKEPDGIGEIEMGYSAGDLRVMRQEVERFAREHLGFGRKDPNCSQPSQAHTGADSKPLRPSQLARASVRAVAALLWHQNPELNIEGMLNRSELRTIGLIRFGHREYETETVRGWIHDLCPNPKPGRPRNAD